MQSKYRKVLEMKTLVLGLMAFATAVSFADATSSKTYWVKADGSDDADCLSRDTAGSVWKGWSIVTNNFSGQAAGSSYNPDTLVFCEGTYDFTELTPGALRNLSAYGTAYLAGESYKLTIKSENDDPATTVLRGAGEGQGTRAFFMNGNCTFSGLTFEDFDSTTIGDSDTARWGGAIHSHKNMCVIGSGWGLDGGASITNCIFRNCRAVRGGAVAYTASGSSEFSMEDCVFVKNYASDRSACVEVGSGTIPCDIVKCTFATNSTPGLIGAIRAPNLVKAKGLKLIGNTSSPVGTGFVEASSSSSALVMSDCDFHDNIGGKILAVETGASIINCAFSNNVSGAGSSGGLCSGGTYATCDFRFNLVTNMVQNGDIQGLCIFNCGMVSNCTFYCNTGMAARYKYGCCVYATQSSSSANWGKVVDCHFEKNGFLHQQNQTRGIAYRAVCEKCTFVDNMNYADGLYGEFIECILANCVVISNSVCQNAPRGALKCPARNCYVKGMYGAYGGGVDLSRFDNCIFEATPYMADCATIVESSAPVFCNCIFWDAEQFAYCQGGYVVMSNCFVKGYGIGNGHVNGSAVWANADALKPLLEAAGCIVYPTTATLAAYGIERDEDGRIRLKKHSRLRDIGLVADWAMVPGCVDLDGNPRLSSSGKIDLGCYQYAETVHGTIIFVR